MRIAAALQRCRAADDKRTAGAKDENGNGQKKRGLAVDSSSLLVQQCNNSFNFDILIPSFSLATMIS
jgi:hypothetical protein